MMTLYDFLRAGHVKRWHIVNTASTQSIAEHSYLVAIIAMQLHSRLDPLDENGPQGTGIYALFHDSTEIKTGDIPTPAKKLMRSLEYQTSDETVFDRIDAALMPLVPFLPGGEPSNIALACVKMADVIEAAHWIRENGMGRHAEIVSRSCWQKVGDLVHEYDTYGEYTNWYTAVNEILIALGMPCVSKDERMSPP